MSSSRHRSSALCQWWAQEADAALASGPEPTIDLAAELESPEPDSQEMLQDLATQLDQLVDEGTLEEDDIKEFEWTAGTAAGAGMMAKLFDRLGAASSSGWSQVQDEHVLSPDELRFAKDEYGRIRAEHDLEYVAHVAKEYERAYGTRPAGTSR